MQCSRDELVCSDAVSGHARQGFNHVAMRERHQQTVGQREAKVTFTGYTNWLAHELVADPFIRVEVQRKTQAPVFCSLNRDVYLTRRRMGAFLAHLGPPEPSKSQVDQVPRCASALSGASN